MKKLTLLILLITISLCSYGQEYFSDVLYESDKATISPGWDNLSVRYHYNFFENAIIHYVPSCDTVLDIGPGYGHWIQFYREIYLAHVDFIEISKKITDSLNVRYQMEGYCSPIEEIILDQKYDVINAIGVLHHITSDKKLKRAIGNIQSMMHENSILLIGTKFDYDPKHRHWKFRNLKQWKDLLSDFEITIVRSDPPWYCYKHLDLIIATK